MTVRFQRKGDSIVVRLGGEERDFLSQILDLLADVDVDLDDPAHRRLNVPVYLDDADANEEWWRLMGGEMTQSRLDDQEVYRRVMSMEKSLLSEDEADAFLRVINQGRLAFGARLGLEVEEDHDRLPEQERTAIDFLGWVLEELTVVLMRGL